MRPGASPPLLQRSIFIDKPGMGPYMGDVWFHRTVPLSARAGGSLEDFGQSVPAH